MRLTNHINLNGSMRNCSVCYVSASMFSANTGDLLGMHFVEVLVLTLQRVDHGHHKPGLVLLISQWKKG
jgi:hypothetical protein